MATLNQNRRDFVKQTVGLAAGATAPYFFSSPRTLADETQAKNDRLRLGLIGAGGMGVVNADVSRQWCDVVAIADVDFQRADKTNQKLSDGKADVYNDYRAILDRDDLDVLHIATPDHWHAKPLVEALLADNDVYCEKPLTLTIDEGKLVRQVMKKTNQIVQVGTQQRSTFNLFPTAIAMVAEGRVGKIQRIQVAIGKSSDSPAIPVANVPKHLDWERWIGPAPFADYRLKKEGKQVFTNG
ncbi:MAG: Gfo/Idh/MocA family oxidoreductase, partial [Pirellulales bacterium]|nr:Gfo/Idh/MocA family oxidoreductase [Pirellulales bacterium]